MKVQLIKSNGDTTEHDVSTFLELRDLLSPECASFADFADHPSDTRLVVFYNEEEPDSSSMNVVFPNIRGNAIIAPRHFDNEVTYGHKMFHIQNIQWDTDNEEVDLPSNSILECEFEDDIADKLSDFYGWCIKGFQVERVEILAHKN
tara:strand:- start:644 stop:1084 length:441 start_codon:yes stop_codon:yes gene_type:complete